MYQKWGQNFLVDKSTAARIVDALDAHTTDNVLEIGPGRGALTELLIDKVKSLTVVELDVVLHANLVRRWGAVPGFQAHRADFLEWPLPSSAPDQFKIIANLPYSVGNAILRKVGEWTGWDTAVFMVQKEVAERMAASPNSRDYGILTLAVQAKAVVRRLFDVSPESFRPVPKVMSTVVRLDRHEKSLIENEAAFFRVVHAAFSQRRKTILNCLASGLDMEKKAVEKKLVQSGLSPMLRAENLTLEDFVRLANQFSNDLT